LPNSEQYLNCHIYPNSTPGSGLIKMEITTNLLHKDTITWNICAINNLTIDESTHLSKSEIKYIYDIQGKMHNTFLPHQMMVIKYKNGLKEKVIHQY
jgi:hypothetical protein